MSCIKTPRPASQSQTFRSMTRSSKQKNFSAITENASAFFNHCSRPLRRENITFTTTFIWMWMYKVCIHTRSHHPRFPLHWYTVELSTELDQLVLILILEFFFFSVLPKMPSRFKICVCFGLLITFFLDRLVSHYICATSCLDYWHLPFLLLL